MNTEPSLRDSFSHALPPTLGGAKAAICTDPDPRLATFHRPMLHACRWG